MSDDPISIDHDRERVACVFSLGGGELHTPHPDFPDEWDGPGGIAHWYEGVPDCVRTDEIGIDHHDEVRTATLDCLFGFPDPPGRWEQVAAFKTSGEAECWWCGDGTGNEDQCDDCKLCEGDGYMYLGDGWREVIYRRTVGR